MVSSLDFLFVSLIPDWMLETPAVKKKPNGSKQTKKGLLSLAKGPRKGQPSKIDHFWTIINQRYSSQTLQKNLWPKPNLTRQKPSRQPNFHSCKDLERRPHMSARVGMREGQAERWVFHINGDQRGKDGCLTSVLIQK